jgi:hypothetical protein
VSANRNEKKEPVLNALSPIVMSDLFATIGLPAKTDPVGMNAPTASGIRSARKEEDEWSAPPAMIVESVIAPSAIPALNAAIAPSATIATAMTVVTEIVIAIGIAEVVTVTVNGMDATATTAIETVIATAAMVAVLKMLLSAANLLLKNTKITQQKKNVLTLSSMGSSKEKVSWK